MIKVQVGCQAALQAAKCMCILCDDNIRPRILRVHSDNQPAKYRAFHFTGIGNACINLK